MELHPRHVGALGVSANARIVDLRVSGGPVTVVYRPVEEQYALRAGGRTLGPRLGVYQVLQALPVGEWVPVDNLTDREQDILPAIPVWTRRRENQRILRLADVPVRLDLLITRGQGWRAALGRSCALGAVAPRMALCRIPGSERTHARLEADYRGVGLAEFRDGDVRVLAPPRPGVPEPVAPLHWQLAERVFARVCAARGHLTVPTGPRASGGMVSR
jgi:hypothetical protein